MRYKTFASLLLCSSPLYAQDFLDPLIVTASRSQKNLSDLPYSVSEVTAQDFLDRKIRTLPDALIYVPGVIVQKTSYGHGSPFIRGFTGRQNLLLVDGIRLNNSTWRSGPVQYWNTVDPFSVSSFELVKSQGSVLYGSDAVGGTLNAFTKSSNFREQNQGQMFHNGSAYYEHRTNGQGSHIGRIESSFGVGSQFGIHLGYSKKDFGDIEDDAIGRMRGTGHPQEDLDLRFDYALSSTTTFTFAHQYVNQDGVSRWHRTLNNPGWTHGNNVAAPGTLISNDYDQERSLTYFRFAGANDEASAFINNWSATFSFQDTADTESRRDTATAARRNTIDTQTYGLDISLESKIGPGSLVYGLDYYMDDVSSSAERTNATGVFLPRRSDRAVADGSSYHLIGTYAQYNWNVTDAFKLVGGTRYTYAMAEWDKYTTGAGPDRGGDESWDDISSNIRALYDINTNWQIHADVSQAFRAPNLSDLTGNQLALAGTTVLGGDVDPEHFITAELGTRYSNEKFSVAVSSFYTWTDGVIIPLGAGATRRVENGQDGFIYGIETEAVWLISDQWSWRGTLGWNEGKTKTTANGERWGTRLLPLAGTSLLRWTEPGKKYWVEAGLIGSLDQGRLNDLDQAADNQRLPTDGNPGYLIASLRAAWQVHPNVELSAALDNILDDDYRYIGSGQNEPGQNLTLGVRATF